MKTAVICIFFSRLPNSSWKTLLRKPQMLLTVLSITTESTKLENDMFINILSISFEPERPILYQPNAIRPKSKYCKGRMSVSVQLKKNDQ